MVVPDRIQILLVCLSHWYSLENTHNRMHFTGTDQKFNKCKISYFLYYYTYINTCFRWSRQYSFYLSLFKFPKVGKHTHIRCDILIMWCLLNATGGCLFSRANSWFESVVAKSVWHSGIVSLNRHIIVTCNVLPCTLSLNRFRSKSMSSYIKPSVFC